MVVAAREPGRREQLVAEAGRLFATRGFHGVSLDELGASVGISGPAVYKHFANKDAILAAVLVGISESLLAGAQAVVETAEDSDEALGRLLDAHTDFALSRPELIKVQDRDLANLSDAAARRVRRLQRAYVEIWVDVLRSRHIELPAADARVRAHAVFGLLNSTPYSAGTTPTRQGAVLREMAWRSLH